jgi:hypothetical protein
LQVQQMLSQTSSRQHRKPAHAVGAVANAVARDFAVAQARVVQVP